MFFSGLVSFFAFFFDVVFLFASFSDVVSFDVVFLVAGGEIRVFELDWDPAIGSPRRQIEL